MMLFNDLHGIRILAAAYLLLIIISMKSFAAEKHIFDVQYAVPVGGASKVVDNTAAGSCLFSLAAPGQGIRLTDLPAASKLAIRYASVEVGTIRVKLNDQPARTVNVHSSGALTGSFLHAIIDMEIPENSVLTISRAENDAAVNTTAQIVTDHEAHMTSIVLHLCLIVEARRASFWYARSAPRGGEIGNTQSRWLCGDNA